MKYPTFDGWIGYGDQGADLLLQTNTPLPDDHPLVKERPELFTGQVLAPVAVDDAAAATIRTLEARIRELEAQQKPASPRPGPGTGRHR